MEVMNHTQLVHAPRDDAQIIHHPSTPLRQHMRSVCMQSLLGSAQFAHRCTNMLHQLAAHLTFCLLRPRELEELTQRWYARVWAVDTVDVELNLSERHVANLYLRAGRRCLVFQSSGERASVAFTRLGHHVTGIESCEKCEKMVHAARVRATTDTLDCTFLLGDLYAVTCPEKHYDVLWLSQGVFSAIPNRSRHLALLQRARTLAHEDTVRYLACHCDDHPVRATALCAAQQRLAALTRGNTELEPGDCYGLNHCWHYCLSAAAVRDECAVGGWDVVEFFGQSTAALLRMATTA
jgi:hypothetical protein